MDLLGIEVLFKGSNALRLLQGLWVSVEIGLISVLLSIVLGILFGVFMTWRNPVARFISRLYLEIVRVMPQLVLLFIVFFGATRVLGINLDAVTSSIIVFTFWGTGEMGDLVRGALISVPKHQYESAAALSFSKMQTYRHIIIPQAIRQIIPNAMSLTSRMIKSTSLVLMIGVVEVMKVGQQIIEANRMSSPDAVFGVFGVILLMYFIICWPLSKLASYLEKKWS